MIGIIDYNMGNIGSIENMIFKIGVKPIISSNADILKTVDKLILPGVGAFDKGVENLKKLKLFNFLKRRVLKDNIPILGICLGLQLFANKSEEGKLTGLEFLDAKVKKFSLDRKFKVPHMGWNTINIERQNLLLSNLLVNNKFYFVHSYYIDCNNIEDSISTTNYGFPFTSACNVSNIWGTQFHPEKSHKYGMKIMENFCNKC